jgi:hypothetical protein
VTVSRVPDIDEFLDDDIEFPGDDWEWGYVAGKQVEQERIVKIVEDYGSEDFTSELIKLIKER